MGGQALNSFEISSLPHRSGSNDHCHSPSEVKSAVVGVQGDDKSLRIKISDEGIGFVLQTTPGQKSSLGLSGMCERACQVGGMLTIEVFQGSVLISAFLAALANNWSKVANQMGLPTRSFAIMADAI